MAVRTNVFVDGFNLYYRLFHNEQRKTLLKYFKWLDIRKLSQRLANPEQVEMIYYFTADIIPSPRDPGQLARQQTYLNALAGIRQIEIVKGQFRPRTKMGSPVNPAKYGNAPIAIRTFEEKGSDVNLAAYLLRDAFTRRMDRAIVISNDADLRNAIDITVRIAGVPVHVVSPDLWVLNDLKAVATTYGIISPDMVKRHQLPNAVLDAAGNTLVRPERWTDPKKLRRPS